MVLARRSIQLSSLQREHSSAERRVWYCSQGVHNDVVRIEMIVIELDSLYHESQSAIGEIDYRAITVHQINRERVGLSALKLETQRARRAISQ